MKNLLLLIVIAAVPATVLARNNGFKVTYDGGSFPRAKAGTAMKLYVATNQIRFEMERADWVTVPANAITEISYGLDVHRRLGIVTADLSASGPQASMAVKNTKRQYIGLTWADGDSTGGLAMQCEEAECGSVLAALQGLTGMKPVNSEIAAVAVMTARN
jgi:hypothetical protein